MLHLSASLISSPLETGVLPKPMAIAFPEGQKAISPKFTTSLALCSGFDETDDLGRNILPGYYLNPRDPADGGRPADPAVCRIVL